MSKVLVADDEKHIVELVCTLLRQSGDYDIETAISGKSALEKLEQLEPDLLIVDYMMPGTNGLEVLNHIRSLQLDTAIICMSGKGSEKVAVQLMKAGAWDYLPKPFRANELLQAVEEALQEHERRKEEQKSPTVSAGSSMQSITGYNENLEHDGQMYHIQTEDAGGGRQTVSSCIYVHGRVIARRDIDYSPLTGEGNREQIVSAVVRRLHTEMVEKLLTGQLDDEPVDRSRRSNGVSS